MTSSRRLLDAATRCVATSLALVFVLPLLRAYEFVIVRRAHPLPAGAVGFLLRGLRSDLQLALLVTAVFALFVIPLGAWRPRVGLLMHRALLILLILAHVALIQYFAVTFVPLGADLFGYSLAEIRQTTMASKGIDVASLIPFALFALLTWWLAGWAPRYRVPNGATIAILSIAALSVAASRSIALKSASFPDDAGYFLAVNQAEYFTSQTAAHVAAWMAARHDDHVYPTYPFVHSATGGNVLGPFLATAPTKPNIVILIVEGLGRDFVGDGARYGGFTPFLDSLTRRSLYWENFHSVGGRTFGVLPALLASLPYADGGFMDLGPHMPSHISLITLLGAHGYATSYFSGTDGHYDNIDLFMQREGIQRFVDKSSYGRGYRKQPPGEGGFSWGYGDDELFRRSLELIGGDSLQPRLDIYKTLTTHEPFIPPRAAEYRAEFERRLAGMPMDTARRASFRSYENIFSTLLYTDHAIASFFHAYEQRADYDRTIFLVTGDHRLIPIPPGSRADRYHVPFILFSPLVRAPRTFASVSSHLDVVPTLLALLAGSYGMSLPQQVPWIGTGIDTAPRFRNIHSAALMRTKNSLDEYLDGVTFLSGDRLFQLDEHFGLRDLHDDRVAAVMRERLATFQRLGRFAMSGDHIYPSDPADVRQAFLEDSAAKALGMAGMTLDQRLAVALRLAEHEQYEAARLVLRRILREAPNDHDARAMLARTYGWEHRFSEARAILTELHRRAPDYADGYDAGVDVELQATRNVVALRLADAGIGRFPQSADLLVGRSIALERLGRRAEAIAAIQSALSIDPHNKTALEAKVRLDVH